MKKFNVTELIMKFSHEIDADKIVFLRTDNPNRTLLGQIEDEINNLINVNKNIFTVTPCHDSEFHGIKCLENDEEYGFFNDYPNDIRPGHCTWINKKEAEKLIAVFK